jgi:hypothetical protein
MQPGKGKGKGYHHYGGYHGYGGSGLVEINDWSSWLGKGMGTGGYAPY